MPSWEASSEEVVVGRDAKVVPVDPEEEALKTVVGDFLCACVSVCVPLPPPSKDEEPHPCNRTVPTKKPFTHSLGGGMEFEPENPEP